MNLRGRALFVGCTLAALSLLTACTSRLHVSEVSIPDAVPLSQFSTYRWQPELLQMAAPEERIDSGFNTLIRQEMDKAMESLGYTRADDDASAIILAFQLTISEAQATFIERPKYDDTQYEELSYGLRWRFADGEVPVQLERFTPAEEVMYFSEGTLHIGAFTPAHDPLWHAMGHKILNRAHTTKEHRKSLQRTVEQIMQRFPAVQRFEPQQE